MAEEIKKPNVESPSARQMADFRSQIQAEKDMRREKAGLGKHFILERCKPEELTEEDFIMYMKCTTNASIDVSDLNNFLESAKASGNESRIAFADYLNNIMMPVIFERLMDQD